MPVTPPSCPACGGELPTGACFCAVCGTRVAPRAKAISWQTAELRYFGVLPGARLLRLARIRLSRLAARLRARLRLVVDVAVARAAAEATRLRLRREAIALAGEHSRQLQRLGEAVYLRRREDVRHAKERLLELDARLAATEAELQAIEERMRGRIRRARFESGSTEAVEEPPGVPEPRPVPHEPPGPVIVPEPHPPNGTS